MVLIIQDLHYDVFEPLAIEFCARVSPVILNQAVLPGNKNTVVTLQFVRLL
jgi:hypothetical protein